jgi:hypothetical protein
MIVENELYADLVIEKGRFTAKSSWIFTGDDSFCGDGKLLEEARKWAGNVGDPLKIPSADGRIFAESTEFPVKRISFEMIDVYRCRIRFTGEYTIQTTAPIVPDDPDEPILPVVQKLQEYFEERCSDGSIIRTGFWQFEEDAAAGVFPAVGQLFEWEGGSFICSRCKIDLLNKSCELTAREISFTQLDGIKTCVDEDHIAEKEICYFTAAGTENDFLSQHQIGSNASWGGENFYLTGISCKPVGTIGFEIRLKAREIFRRQLTLKRKEEVIGYYLNGQIKRFEVWTAEYQSHKNDLEEFRDLLGSSPEWANEGMIVSNISEKKISSEEYRITLEARRPKFLEWKHDPEEYEGRVDHKIDVAEFFITAEMAGYVNVKGRLEPIVGWNMGLRCPFETNNELGLNYANSIVKILQITVIEYIKGSCKNLIDEMTR